MGIAWIFEASLLFRVFAVADGSDSEAPVLVVVRHEKGVLSWQVSCCVYTTIYLSQHLTERFEEVCTQVSPSVMAFKPIFKPHVHKGLVRLTVTS